MNLTYFSKQTIPQSGVGNRTNSLPKVYFHKKGSINFNKAASELMDIKPGDKITLAYDDDNPEQWYFFKDEQHGFELRLGYNKRGCIFSHSLLIKEILTVFEMDPTKNYSFLLAGQPTMMKGDKTKYWRMLILITNI